MKMKKLLSSGMSLLLATALLAGCGGAPQTSAVTESAQGSEAASAAQTQEASSEAAESASDEIVTLKWYMSINPVAADTDKVMEKINEYTKEKIGVEIDYTVIANPDYKEKMPTLINSGDYFDICFTANWTTNYTQFAGRGAFMDIKELLPQYAKETWEFIPQELWTAASIDGASAWQKIRYITIPSLLPTMMIMVLLAIGNIFRGDFGLFYQTVKSSALLQPVTDVIDTYVFRLLINNSDIGVSAAAGLYQSVLCFITITICNKLVKKADPDYALY